MGYWDHVHQIVRVQKDVTVMLFVRKTVILVVAGNAPEFITGSGIVIPVSVDPSDFCRSFSVESKTTIEMYIGHDVLLIHDFNNVIERNQLFEISTSN